MRLVQMKPVHELTGSKEYRLLKIIPMAIEAGIPLTQQPMDPLCNELPGLLLEPLHHYSLKIFA
jgi:hypothetical protein